MCLGIPGRIAEFDDTNPHLAMVEVTGVRRRIHVGFAMSRIDEDEPDRALDGLRLMGVGFDEDLAQLLETDPG